MVLQVLWQDKVLSDNVSPEILLTADNRDSLLTKHVLSF